MELVPPLSVAPATTTAVLGALALGVALGTLSGLTPGLHVNLVAVLLAALAPSLPGTPLQVGVTILAAGTVHTFLDVVPTLALGVPDAALAATALPGHKLVLAGRGREALRLSALGSGLALAVAVPLAAPVTAGMRAVLPVLEAHRSLALGGVAVLLVLAEPGHRRRIGAALSLGASGVLGLAALDLATGGLAAGGPLTPLFGGLFGAPILLQALGGAGVPAQGDPALRLPRRDVALTAGVGTLAGAAVGYVPGLSSAIGAAGALAVLPRRGARTFVVATSGVNTATALFGLFALVAFGEARTGVLVAVETAGVPLSLPVLLATVCLAGAVGFVLVPLLGDPALAAVGVIDTDRLTLAVLGLLVLASGAVAGLVGVVLLCAATGVGLVAPAFGARRVSAMGVLLVPLAV
jgi:putative membrane protein